jgi:hypothetical protein
MKKFLINFKEVTYGVVEVFAENEDEARELAETDGMRYEDNSEMELCELVSEEDIDEEKKLGLITLNQKALWSRTTKSITRLT